MTATLATFVVGILLGVIAAVTTAPQQPSNPYAVLPRADEPSGAAQVVDAMRRDDANTLGSLLPDGKLLNKLHASLNPIVLVNDISFVGATQNVEGTTLSAYVVRGRDGQGMKLVRGFVLQIVRNEVVDIN